MSYPNPSSLNKQSQPLAHPSLPARPPAAAGYVSNGGSNSTAPSSGRGQITSTNFKPRSLGSAQPSPWPRAPQSGAAAAYPAPDASYAAATSYNAPQSYGAQPQSYYPNQTSGAYDGQSQSGYGVSGVRNHGQGHGRGRGQGNNDATGYDDEHAAQIAQWQSAYAPAEASSRPTVAGKPDNANHTPLGSASRQPTGDIDIGKVAAPSAGVAAVVSGADGSQKTVLRSGGGKTWQDSSLLEWDPAHPRLFIGNLAGEVTDDSLLKAFSRYPSVQKAKVVRDKRTTKSKGFGFVSFSSSDDYFQAAKEMQGKYIGSHPVTIKRSTTEIKASAPQPRGGKQGKNNRNNTDGAANLHANTGAGIEKKQPKKKGGIKFLG